MVVVYLLLFSVYWTWSLVRLVVDLRPLLEMRSFCVRKLQLSDRDIQTITWPEVVARVVHLQATTRLCIVRDLNEHDIVARILRKENYLLGMLNRGVLGLTLDVPACGQGVADQSGRVERLPRRVPQHVRRRFFHPRVFLRRFRASRAHAFPRGR